MAVAHTVARGTLWHVTLVLAGDPAPMAPLARALRQLCDRDPGNMAARYRADHAELQFWDEGRELEQVVLAAARLWTSSRHDAGLPDWTLVGLEVLERTHWRQRRAEPPSVIQPGAVVRAG